MRTSPTRFRRWWRAFAFAGLLLGSAVVASAQEAPRARALAFVSSEPSLVNAGSRHFKAYAAAGSPAAADLAGIVAAREAALGRLERFFRVRYGGVVTLVFFSNEEAKFRATGVRGFGWAGDGVMLEVYNASTKVDPFHELTHIVAGQLGHPPALFDEGAAMWCAQHFGGDALGLFGVPAGTTLDGLVRRNIDEGRYMPLAEVFRLSEIGSARSRAPVSYPEAGSFVGFLVARGGPAKLRRAFAGLKSSDDPRVIAMNEKTFTRIYRMDISDAERAWRRAIGRPLPAQGPRHG